ncbi:MAG TPA: aspartate aminotransferase family protein [Nitrososphaeraceae archaeon]|nr:aspartate aminotransferase family protein [Nitrososphaeraceae archaeon]MDW3625039.1 aspartate aminotransferase family protein [Nitrososphaeraceae archaeon]HJY10062.1 aspartate aminotransferase family protein [Nitrososphaeraceae archaeon]
MSEDNYLGNLYQRFPINISKGKGAIVWDVSGNEYIDCMGGYGVALIGHCNDRVVNAIKNQSEKLITCHMSIYNNVRLEFLEKMSKISPKKLSKIFFSNSGAESTEAALKFSRKFTGKSGIIAMSGGYHGKTFGALSVTHNEKYRKSFQPLLEGVKFVPYSNPSKIEESLDDSIGTVIIEPIQGETGIIVPSDGVLQQIRKICDQNNLVLIFDEIQTGLGRTGRMWAGEHWSTTPDIMCLAKGIAGGLPMGLTLCKPEILDAMKVGEHSSTFAGNPLSCSAGIATIESIIEENLVENAAKVGNIFKNGLFQLKENHRIVRDVRGLGLMLALELRFDIKDILFDGIKEGLLMLYSGRNIIRLLPPLVLDEVKVAKTLSIMDKLLTKEEERKDVK